MDSSKMCYTEPEFRTEEKRTKLFNTSLKISEQFNLVFDKNGQAQTQVSPKVAH